MFTFCLSLFFEKDQLVGHPLKSQLAGFVALSVLLTLRYSCNPDERLIGFIGRSVDLPVTRGYIEMDKTAVV